MPNFDDEQDAAGRECESDRDRNRNRNRNRSSDLRQRLLSHLRDPDYEPQNKSELSRAMEVDSRDRAELRGELRALEAEGLIVKIKKGRYELCESAGNTLIGTIRRDRKGNVFFHPDGNSAENKSALKALELEPEASLYVPDKFAHTSLHGDQVVVKVLETGIPKWWKHVKRKRDLLREIDENAEKRLEARVVKILERRNNRIVGTFRRQGKFDYVQPDDSLLPDTIDVQVSTDTQVQPGDKVIVTIEEWHSRNRHPRGRIVRSLGPADAPGVDILSIIHQHQLPLEFPPKVLQDAASIEETIHADEIAAREDWRDQLVVTIDPFDAKDFDDAIAVRRLPGEACGWELAVHIADVSHYVRPGSAIDREANDRGNSVYLVDRVIPMLPEQLSNGICSLKPGVDRLTRAAIMEFDVNGNRTRTRFCSAVIRSACRLTYEEAIVRMRDKSPGADADADADAEGFDSTQPWIYEITPAWESGLLTEFTGSITIPAAAVKAGSTYRARVRHLGASGQFSHWSDPIEFTAGSPDTSAYLGKLLISEVMYQPASPTAAELAADATLTASSFEFIEIVNAGTSALDLTNVRFTKGVEFDFANGTVTSIDPGQRVVIVGNLAAFNLRYGSLTPAPVVAGTFDKNLSNAGEQLKLSFGAGIPLVDFEFSDGGAWPDGADREGQSLVLIRPGSSPDSTLPASWRESALVGGSPGFDDAIPFAGDPAADADGDQLSAFAEYAFGTSDDVFNSGAEWIGAAIDLFTDEMTNERRPRLELSFPWRAGADSAAYTIETSTDLAVWKDVTATMILQKNDSNGDGTQRLTFRQESATAGPVVYARVRVNFVQ